MENKNEEVQEYIEQLNEMEKITMEIAIKHLESSFDVEKSIGYLNWKKNKDSN